MPRASKRGTPGYLRHRDRKRGDRAFVLIEGKRLYLGKWNSPESRVAYDRVIAEWLARGRSLPEPTIDDSGPTIAEVMEKYWKYAKVYYRHEDGTPTGEAERSIRYALRPVRRLYGTTPARDFGPACLEAVRNQMIESGVSRRVVNQRISIVRRMFRWAEAKELLPRGTFHNLATLEPLKAGRSAARETAPVEAVSWEHVEATLQHLPAKIAAMVLLQWETGMRPGEVVQIRGVDIERSHGDVWLYAPSQHKNKHRGKDRVVPLLARSQAILQPFLDEAGDPSRFVFTPSSHAARRDHYTTLTYGREIRRACERVSAPGRRQAILAAVLPMIPDEAHARFTRVLRRLSARFSRKGLANAIRRAGRALEIDPQPLIDAAIEALSKHRDALPVWAPNQLRHAAATRIGRTLSVEDARLVLQHSSETTTRRYFHPDVQRAIDSLRKLG